MSWLSSFLHPERGYQAAQGQLDKYYNQGQGYMQPYNQHGQDVYSQLGPALQMLLNPQELQDKWASGYNESDYAKMLEDSAKQQGLDAASSMGLLGSTPALQAIQAGMGRIRAEDRQNYMNDLFNKFQLGTNLGQNIYNTGANTANQMANNAMNMGQNSAGMQFNQTNAPGQTFGGIAGLLAKLGGNYLTGGFGKGDFGRGAWSIK